MTTLGWLLTFGVGALTLAPLALAISAPVLWALESLAQARRSTLTTR
jgi:hypothetical protein